ncbi:MAG: hypothetical protein ACOX9B_06950 [Candidatus Xenobium sp.]|nr:hypothetical protein [Burkholderiales bacterium]
MNSRPLVPRWFAVMLAASVAIVLLGITRPETHRQAVPEPQLASAAADGLAECVWLDRLPEDPYEPFQLYYFTEEGGRVGLNAKADSAFRILLEVFEFIDLPDQGRLQFYFPHDRSKPASTYTIEKLKKPTAYFDTKLTLDNDPRNGGKKKVYFTGPEFRADSDGRTLPEHLRQVLLQIRSTR